MKIKFLSFLTMIMLGAFCMVSCGSDDDDLSSTNNSGQTTNGSGTNDGSVSKLKPTDEYYWLDTQFYLNDGRFIYYPNGSHTFFKNNFFVGLTSEIKRQKNVIYGNDRTDYKLSWYSEVWPKSEPFITEDYEAEFWTFYIACSVYSTTEKPTDFCFKEDLYEGMSLGARKLYFDKTVTTDYVFDLINSAFLMTSGSAKISEMKNGWVVLQLDNAHFEDIYKKSSKTFTLTGKICLKMK